MPNPAQVWSVHFSNQGHQSYTTPPTNPIQHTQTTTFLNFSIGTLFSIHYEHKNKIHNSMMILSDEEKLKFVNTSGSWIEGKDIMDTCFLLNFGYEAPLPWPQV